MTEFDAYAHEYDTALNCGLAVSGEDKTFFAKGRISWLSRCLKKLAVTPKSVLDYGCGTGTAAPYFFDILAAESAVGVDLSEKSLEVARRTNVGLPVEYNLTSEYSPKEEIDLAFCNGVFHHIPPADRPDIARYIAGCLRTGGLFALWENNPWNPGTRYIMSKIPFDRDASLLCAGETRKLLDAAGFSVIRTDYCFIFPKALKGLRSLEPWVSKVPLGAQYQVLVEKR